MEKEGKPLAQIRFQVKKQEAVLGYLVDKAWRGIGLGATILSKGIELFSKELNQGMDIVGFVKFSNLASQRSFERLSFQKAVATELESSYKYSLHYHGN